VASALEGFEAKYPDQPFVERGQRLYQVEEDLGRAHKLLIMPDLWVMEA